MAFLKYGIWYSIPTMGVCNRQNGCSDGETDGAATVSSITGANILSVQIPKPKSDSTTAEPTTKPCPVPIKFRQSALRLGCWNIRRGLVKREIELTQMLMDEELDILFLTETDTKIENEKDFKIAGYKTIFHVRVENAQKVRMMCLVNEASQHIINVRPDLMSDLFVSIWLEVKTSHNQFTLVSGFYREWTHEGDKSRDCQVERMGN